MCGKAMPFRSIFFQYEEAMPPSLSEAQPPPMRGLSRKGIAFPHITRQSRKAEQIALTDSLYQGKFVSHHEERKTNHGTQDRTPAPRGCIRAGSFEAHEELLKKEGAIPSHGSNRQESKSASLTCRHLATTICFCLSSRSNDPYANRDAPM